MSEEKEEQKPKYGDGYVRNAWDEWKKKAQKKERDEVSQQKDRH